MLKKKLVIFDLEFILTSFLIVAIVVEYFSFVSFFFKFNKQL